MRKELIFIYAQNESHRFEWNKCYSGVLTAYP